MASGGQFEYDAIIFHSEDELDQAREFCEFVITNIGVGPPLNMSTFEDFGMPGRTHVQNMEDAVKKARFIFCCEHYYHTDRVGTFAGQLALWEQIPEKLIKISTDRTVGKTPIMKTVAGIDLKEDWTVPPTALKKLKKLFRGISEGAEGKAAQDKGLSELLSQQPSSPQQSPSSMAESFLAVANSSLDSAESSAGGQAGYEREAGDGRKADTPPMEHTELKTVFKVQRDRPDIIGGSTDLKGDDLQEDNDSDDLQEDNESHASGMNFNRNASETPFKTQARRRDVPLQCQQGTENQSSSSDKQGGRGPSNGIVVGFCIVACVVALTVALVYSLKG